MKLKFTLILIVLANIMTVSGCSKKEEPVAPSPQDAEQQADDSLGKAADAVGSETEVAEGAFSTDIDLEKTVTDLQAEAVKMNVESLRSLALKYKDAITQKQAEWKVLTDKLAAVPATEKMGEEARTLQNELSVVAESSQEIMQRFNLYLGVIKEKGGETEDLAIE